MTQDHKTPVQHARKQTSYSAKKRRSIARWSAFGILTFIPISLYQLGAIKHLPDPLGKVFDSDFVNSSEDAQFAGMPDGPVSLLMYAANLVLVTAAFKKEKKKNSFDYMIATNAFGQAAGGTYYLYKMATKEKKICPYCVTGAVINFAALLPAAKLLRQ